MAAKAELRARATLDNSGFQRGIAQMQGSVRGFASGQIAGLGRMIGGAFAVTAVTSFARNIMEAGDNLQDMARNLGIGVEQLQALQVTADRTGASAEQMNAVLMRAAKAGVGIEEVARAYLGMEGASMSVADAQKIVGRGGAALNDTFNQIANDGLSNMTSAMLNANQIMSEDTVNATANMQEAYERVAKSITTTLATALVKVVEQIKYMAAYTGALTTGASFDQASTIAQQTVNEELFRKPTALKRGAIASKAAKSDNWKAPEMGDISVSAPTAADSLARIGGIAGGQTNPLKGALERQQKILEEQAKIQKAIEEHSKKTAAATERTAEVMEEE